MSQGLTPMRASSTILLLTYSGRGRPLTNTPPSWLTPAWPAITSPGQYHIWTALIISPLPSLNRPNLSLQFTCMWHDDPCPHIDLSSLWGWWGRGWCCTDALSCTVTPVSGPGPGSHRDHGLSHGTGRTRPGSWRHQPANQRTARARAANQSGPEACRGITWGEQIWFASPSASPQLFRTEFEITRGSEALSETFYPTLLSPTC